jgi:MATE family multidrug resistance protein
LCIEILYVVPVSFVEIATPNLLLELFGLRDQPGDIHKVAAATSQVLWIYSIAFALKMTGAAVLESFGLTKFLFATRVLVMWGLSIPIVYFVASRHSGSAEFLPGCWIIGALFEGAIGGIYLWRLRIAVKHRQNKIVLHAQETAGHSPAATLSDIA